MFKIRASYIVTLCLSLALILTVGMTGLVEARERHVIKFATLAPEGSSWMKQMRELALEVKQKTQGQVEFKFYPGGVAGDEKDVIRKIRIGQLHSAGFTGVGLGDILPEVRVLDLPFLFETDEEVAHVYNSMDEYFMRAFEDKGYVLLGWVPVGWVHFFSVSKIESMEDLRRSRPWLWAGDPLVESAYQAMDVNPVPLALPDVLMSLQTGMVDVVYGSPQGALALQWFSRVKHMTSFRMGYATGGVLISKRKFNQLPEDIQSVLKSIAKNHLNKLMKIIQSENMESIQIMQENGVTLTPELSKSSKSGFLQAGSTAREQLTEKLFSNELLKKVDAAIAEARK